MKNFFKKITQPKTLLAFGAAVAATAVLGTAAIATFGPDRPTREWTATETGFDYVTFNSFTGVPNGIGDERDFLRGVINEDGGSANWSDPVNDVKNQDVVTAKIYIHNNADVDLNDAPGQPGVARDVNVQIDIPSGLKADHEVKSFISASNAQPQVVFDTLDIDSINDSLFQLSYVPGSAKMGGVTLSDAIFGTGVELDDHYGCFEYVREITFEMKIEKPGYYVQKDARIKGEGSDKWRDAVNAEVGDNIEWKISFQNIGSIKLEDVIIADDLPTYTTVVPESVKLYNASNPSGYTYGSEAIQNNGDTVNINIDDYAPGGNAVVILETTIDNNEVLECGIHRIANTAYATPEGFGPANDSAVVNVIAEKCEEEKVVTVCNSLTVPTLALRKGESTVFTANATAEGTTVDSYEFKVNGEVVQNTSDNTYTFTAGDAGSYNVVATILFANGDRETNENCAKTVTVVEEQDPIAVCEQFVLALNDRKATVSFVARAENGATFKDATIVYTADGVKKNEELTNKVSNDGKVVSTYTFDKKAVNVYAKATVRFNITKQDSSREIKEVTCQGKAVLSATTPPKELPNTGAGSTVIITMMAVAGAGSIAHRKRTLARQ